MQPHRVVVYPGEAYHVCFPQHVLAEGWRDLILESTPGAVHLSFTGGSFDLRSRRLLGSSPKPIRSPELRHMLSLGVLKPLISQLA